MGTRADFYVGRGTEAEWIGSIALDGYPDGIPDDGLVVRLSKHLCAVVDGVVRDTFDPTRGGDRCVYGYWRAP